jgi:hypothetical protein
MAQAKDSRTPEFMLILSTQEISDKNEQEGLASGHKSSASPWSVHTLPERSNYLRQKLCNGRLLHELKRFLLQRVFPRASDG